MKNERVSRFDQNRDNLKRIMTFSIPKKEDRVNIYIQRRLKNKIAIGDL